LIEVIQCPQEEIDVKLKSFEDNQRRNLGLESYKRRLEDYRANPNFENHLRTHTIMKNEV